MLTCLRSDYISPSVFLFHDSPTILYTYVDSTLNLDMHYKSLRNVASTAVSATALWLASME